MANNSSYETPKGESNLPKWVTMKEDIVISGISGIFPNSVNMNEFIDNLYNGVDCVNACRPRWTPGIYGIQKEFGNIPDDLNKFDADFFGYSDKEANGLDFQLRLLLEKTYEAILDSGVDSNTIRGTNVGYYLGSRLTSDSKVSLYFKQTENFDYNPIVTAVQSNVNFDFRGQTIGIDTACASSFSALDQAVMALRTGECESALVAGFIIDINIPFAKMFMDLKMTSPDSKCKAFDASANGYGRSEAMCVVFLQKRSAAKRVYAIVRNVKSNCDGYKDIGITFPRWNTQAALITNTFKEVNIDPLKVKYIETHTTGTKAGDPVECKAIAESMCKIGNGRDAPLLIGALKSNIGHTEWASGLAAIAKVIISFENKCIPRNLHLNVMNPDIPELFDGSFKPIVENTPFDGGIVSINNFGFGGANCHLIIESHNKEADERSFEIIGRIPRLVLMCGRTEDSLTSIFEYIEENARNGKISREFLSLINDISKQQKMKFRGSLILKSDGQNKISYNKISSVEKVGQIWYIFAGLGSQCTEMAAELMNINAFSKTIYNLCHILRPYNIDLIKLLTTTDISLLSKPIEAFVSVAAFQMAVIDLLKFIGIKPDFMIGHSIGELGCAYADNVIDAEQTISAAYWRGKCVESEIKDKGLMAVIGMTLDEAQKRCRNGIVIACHNSHNSVTIAGPFEETSQLLSELFNENIFIKEIDSSVIPYHTPIMSKITESLSISLKSIGIKSFERSVKWISTFDQNNSTDYKYLIDNLIKPVKFYDAIIKIPQNATVIEISPKAIFGSIIRQTIGSDINYIPIAGRNSRLDDLFVSIGKLYESGYDPQIEKLYPKVEYPVPRGTPFLSPLIKWDHSKSWFVVDTGEFFKEKDRIKQTWKVRLSDPEYKCLSDHIIDGRCLFPAVAYLYIAWKTMANIRGVRIASLPIQFENVLIKRATVMSKESETVFDVHYFESSNNFQIVESQNVCVSGHMFVPQHQQSVLKFGDLLSEKLRDDNKEWLQSKDFYKEMRLRGYDYEQEFQGISCISFDGNHSRVKWTGNWITFMDSMLQTELLSNSRNSLFVPTSIDMIRLDPNRFDVKEEKVVDVIFDSNTKLCVCDAIEALGLKFTRIARKCDQEIILENIEFISNDQELALNQTDHKHIKKYLDSCQVLAQMIENVVEDKESPELSDDFDEYLKSIELDRNCIEKYQLFNLLYRICCEFDDSKNYWMFVEDMISKYNIKLHEDILYDAFIHSDRLTYPIIDTVMENISVNSTINLLEVNCGANIFTPNISEVMVVNNRQFMTTIMHTNENLIPHEISEKYSINQLKLKTINIGEYVQPLSQDFVIYRDLTSCSFQVGKECDTNSMLEAIYESLAFDGFLLTIIRLKSFTFENCLIEEPIDLDNNFNQFSAKAEDLGLIRICSKYDSISTYAILWRKVNPDLNIAKHHIVSITNKNYSWIDQLKEAVSTVGKNDRIWLTTNETINGIYGLINCLRKEINGDVIRCLISEDKIEDSIPEDIIKRDLFQNIYLKGKWGEFRHSLVDRESFLGMCEHAFISPKTIGDLSSFVWNESSHKYWSLENRSDKSNESLITVYNTGMNFKDVMLATGRIQSDKTSDDFLCIEFSGMDQNGKRVMGFMEGGALATTLVVKDIYSIWSVPDGWSMEDAATVPIVYGTSYYSLIIRANLKPREKVLIHSGSGGVGCAAIRICLSMNCDIFTTVGSREKKEFLIKEFPQLNENQIFNSRDTKFESQIMKLTNGYGVDLVLNSLSGQKLIASVKCLAKNGRFCEIGRYDMTIDSELDLSILEVNQVFHGIIYDLLYDKKSLSVKSEEHRKLVHKLLIDGINNGVVKPLPRTVFEKECVEEAFRYMSTGKHTGKIVIKIREENWPQSRQLQVMAVRKTVIKPNKSVIVTGGLGGFGLELVQWLAERGANNILITSRSGPKESYHHYVLNKLEQNGVNVQIWRGDARNQNDVSDIISMAQNMADVAAIFHVAMILHDSLLVNQTVESFSKVADTKYLMAHHFDKLSRIMCPNLDYFVVFSSVTSGLGNAGQTNYGYGNSICERICESRHDHGLHGLAIQWGPIGDAGFMVESLKVNELFSLSLQRMPSCLSTLDSFLNSNHTVVSSKVHTRKQLKSGIGSDLLTHVRHIMGINKTVRLDPKARLLDLGIDSLMAVEIKLIIEKEFNNSLSNEEIRNLTIQDIIDIQSRNDLTFKTPIPVSWDKNLTELPVDEMQYLNKIQTGRPIFCFPSLGDHFQLIKTFTEKLKNPVIGLNWTNQFNNLSSIEEVAEKWIEVIEKSNTNHCNEYNFIGYSFGGIVAFEIAIRLQKMGKIVKNLILLDSTPSKEVLRKFEFDFGKVLDFSNDLMVDIEIIFKFIWNYVPINHEAVKNDLINCKSDDERYQVAINYMKSKGMNSNESIMISLMQCYYKMTKMMINYKGAHRFEGNVLLIRADQSNIVKSSESVASQDYGISEQITGECEVIKLNGDHQTFIGNNLNEISEIINKKLID